MNNKPKKGRGFIYKYTSPSGKSYIGQTIQSLENRAGHNGKNYIGCKYFYSAIKKYGWNNFIVEILGEFPIEQLNFQERRFIEIFNTLAPNGYNIQFFENDYHKGRKRIYQYDTDGNLIKGWEGQLEAATSLNINQQSLNQCLKGNQKSCGGYYWSYLLLEKFPIKEKIDNTEKIIYMCDLNGKVLSTFNSIAKAADFIGGERGAIKRCCRNELKTAYGYKWKCPEILKEKKYNNTPIPIQQIDINNNEIIHTFSSISEAARSLNKSGTSLIRKAINNENYTAYGYKWRKAQSSTTNDS